MKAIFTIIKVLVLIEILCDIPRCLSNFFRWFKGCDWDWDWDCLVCSDGESCPSCIDGYRSNLGVCTRCDHKCATCDNNGDCISCKVLNNVAPLCECDNGYQ